MKFIPLKESTVLKLSEKWIILEDFNGNYYILNIEDGRWYEISPLIFKFFSLLDGKKTLKEIMDVISQIFFSNKTLDKDLDFFLKKV